MATADIGHPCDWRRIGRIRQRIASVATLHWSLSAVSSLSAIPPELRPLASELDEARPRVVFVVGAGVAIGATNSAQLSWLGLLECAIAHLVTTGEFTDARGQRLRADLQRAFTPFKLDDALKHAEYVEQSLNILGVDDYRAWLGSTFARVNPVPNKTATLEQLRNLERAGATLLTTNYDSLLSDATGLEPVTWEEHDEFYRVMIGARRGILHLHGHWERPTSVILGRSAYQRITEDGQFQDLLKALWLGNAWAYVGCGDGLDDPNVGKLLSWSRHWAKSARPDYFLGPSARVGRSRAGSNIVTFGYGSHDDLPTVLHTLEPASRAWPFIPVDHTFKLCRIAGASTPVPSYAEYTGHLVPTIAADDLIRQKLLTTGSAFLEGPAASGKTTLGIRLATQRNESGRSFYLDLGEGLAEEAQIVQAVGRLAREGTLLVIDNIQRQPATANALWDRWRDLGGDVGQLLLISTLSEQPPFEAPDASLARLRRDVGGGVAQLRSSPEDFARIAKYLIARDGRGRAPEISLSDAQRWRTIFGGQLHAFCLAVLNNLYDLRAGSFELSMDAAHQWVRTNWLGQISANERDNAICLAAHGAQELELAVVQGALPFPGAVDELLRVGIARQEVDQTPALTRYSLVEPGWGALLIGAAELAHDDEQLISAAARHPAQALLLLRRWRRLNQPKKRTELFKTLSHDASAFVIGLSDLPMNYLKGVLDELAQQRQWDLLKKCLRGISASPSALARRAWDAPVSFLAAFMGFVASQNRDTKSIWQAIERAPVHLLLEGIQQTPLHHVVALLRVAAEQQRSTAYIWAALQQNKSLLESRLRLESLEGVAAFLELAGQQTAAADSLWQVLEADTVGLHARLTSCRLGQAAHLLTIAENEGRDTEALWQHLERDRGMLAERLQNADLLDLVAFVDAVVKAGRDADAVWDAVEGSSRWPSASQVDNLAHAAAVFSALWRSKRDQTKCVELFRSQIAVLRALVARASSRTLAGFVRAVPNELLTECLNSLTVDQWAKQKTFVGAAWVARKCEDIGLADLSHAISDALLRRARASDFPSSQSMSLFLVAWLITKSKSVEETHRVLATLSSEDWLAEIYSGIGEVGAISLGLMAIAQNQPPETCRLVHSPMLGRRLIREFSSFERSTVEEQAKTIRLLGSASLCGWKSPRKLLQKLKAHILEEQVERGMQHRAVEHIEDRMYEYWIGLRVLVSIVDRPIKCRRAFLVETRDRWAVNLSRSREDVRSIRSRIDESMVRWLDGCVREEAVIADEERIWELRGFPKHIEAQQAWS